MEKRNRYVGLRYVPKVIGEWDKTKDYEPLMIVTHEGNSYTSKTFIPSGVDITNESFWCLTGNYNAQIELLRQNFDENSKNLENSFSNLTDKIKNDFKTSTNNYQIKLDDVNSNLKNFFVNVKDYGAVGDGVVDDTDSVKKALADGNNIFFPTGTYLISQTIELTKNTNIYATSTVGVWGSKDTTILKSNGNNFIFKCSYGNSNNFYNITFDGFGIDSPSCSVIDNCSFKGQIGIQNLRVMTINKCSFNACVDSGIKTLTDSRVSNCFIYKCGTGINMLNSNDNIISNNKIEWNGNGIVLDTNVYNLISSNIFDRNTNYGIYSKNGSQLSIIDNQFERNLKNHIRLNSSYASIKNNEFFEKNSEDDQSGTILPITALNVESVENSSITNNCVISQKMFESSYLHVNNLEVKDNTINGISDSPTWFNLGNITIKANSSDTFRYNWTSLNYLNANGYDVDILNIKVCNDKTSQYNNNYYTHADNGLFVNITNNNTSDINYTIYALFEHNSFAKR